jgi:hypothetical protein
VPIVAPARRRPAPDRVDQVVSWTNEIQGLTVITGNKDKEAKLDISCERGLVEADHEIALDSLRRRVLRYFDVPVSTRNSEGPRVIPATDTNDQVAGTALDDSETD